MTEATTFSFEELIEVENIERTELARWVERQWVLPVRAGDSMFFTEADVARARLLRTLGRDMDFDDDTVDLLLSLIDEIHVLRTSLTQLSQAIRTLPDSARHDLMARLDEARDQTAPAESESDTLG